MLGSAGSLAARLDRPWLLWLVLAALGFVVAWAVLILGRWIVRGRGATDEEQPGRGPEPATTSESSEMIYDQLRRWFEEGHAQLTALDALLQERERLREEVAQNREDIERVEKEREEITQTLSQILLRLLERKRP